MDKKLKVIIVIGIAVPLIFYFISAFIVWNLNPAYWSVSMRGAVAITALMMTICIIGAYYDIT